MTSAPQHFVIQPAGCGRQTNFHLPASRSHCTVGGGGFPSHAQLRRTIVVVVVVDPTDSVEPSRGFAA